MNRQRRRQKEEEPEIVKEEVVEVVEPEEDHQATTSRTPLQMASREQAVHDVLELSAEVVRAWVNHESTGIRIHRLALAHQVLDDFVEGVAPDEVDEENLRRSFEVASLASLPPPPPRPDTKD